MAVSTVSYRLRAGEITPALSTCGGGVPDYFYIQTFGAEKIVTDFDDAKITILASDDMQGQKPGNIEDPDYIATTYFSASYAGRPLRTTDGDLVFSATEQHVSLFINEEEIGIV